MEEANNLLRLKVDVLRDMLSETAAESRLMEKELEELKSISRRRKKHPEDICQEQREKPIRPVSYTHLTLPTTCRGCRSRWSPYH